MVTKDRILNSHKRMTDSETHYNFIYDIEFMLYQLASLSIFRNLKKIFLNHQCTSQYTSGYIYNY